MNTIRQEKPLNVASCAELIRGMAVLMAVAASAAPAEPTAPAISRTAVTIEAGADWIPLPYDPWIEPESALDFSSVLPHHAPAGKFGRVVAVGDHFEFEGLPGVPQRFYGVNLCNTANLPSSREAADRFVDNLVRMGYNALRIHHHERFLIVDNGWYYPGQDDTMPTPEQWEKFDNLVAACVDRGVYLTTDLFVSRSYSTPWRAIGIDRDGLVGNAANYKILCAFWEPAFSNLCAWTEKFLCHVNSRTGRSLAEEPALATLSFVNEGNLGNWGGGALRAHPSVATAWEEWIATNKSRAKSAKSAKEEHGTLRTSRTLREESFDWDSIPDDLPDDLKASGDTPEGRRAAAVAMFLAERETRLFERLKAFVRDKCGCRAPVSNLSSWYNPVQYQMPRTHFDFVDDHFYVDHPKFLEKQWSLPSSCPNRNPIAGYGAGGRDIEWRRLMDKPFCLTEWNFSGPGRFRGCGGIVTGALGALQGWDGMWRFAWSHDRAGVENPGGRMDYFNLNADPLGLASERAALCLFLRRDLPELEVAYPLVLDESTLCDPRTGAPKCELPALLWTAWYAKVGTEVKHHAESAESLGRARSPSAPPHATLSTTSKQAWADLVALGAEQKARGAVRIDQKAGTFLIDTPRTSGGFAESGAHDAGVMRFDLGQPEADIGDSSFVTRRSSFRGGNGVPATVWASSLDGQPLASSSRILVTHLTDVQNSGVRYRDPELTILEDWGGLPHLARNGAVDIELTVDGGALGDRALPVGADRRAARSGSADGPSALAGADRRAARSAGANFTVYRLSSSGHRLAEIPASFDPDTGRLRFTARTDYDPAEATLFYEIVRETPSPTP